MHRTTLSRVPGGRRLRPGIPGSSGRKGNSPCSGAAGTAGPDRYGDAIPTAALLSFRLGGTDGVAVETAKWQGALARLGFATFTVAGGGPVDHLLPGLAIGADEPPTLGEVDAALAPADVVVVENLCSLPLNPRAADVVATALAGRPAVLHHHDLPWQRVRFAHHPPPPTDPRWSQVTINELSRRQLGNRGLKATTVYNAFDVPAADRPGPASGPDDTGPDAASRERVRRLLDVGPDECLVLQPTRAIPRKNVPGGVELCARLGATFWLLGPAEDGYDDELQAVMASARCRVLSGSPGHGGAVSIIDAYRACDVVALPSTWEGFGNPTVESAIHRRPLAIGPYPVAAELAAFGFDWFGLGEADRLAAWLAEPDPNLLHQNLAVAAAHFSLRDLPDRIAAILPSW